MIVVAAFVVVVALDQSTKALVVGRFAPGAPGAPLLFGIRIRHLRNARPGAGLALRPHLLFAIWILIGCSVPLLLAASGSLHLAEAQIALGAILAGTLSNLIDTATRGAVIDLIDLRMWPVFNLADAAILVGISLIIWSRIA